MKSRTEYKVEKVGIYSSSSCAVGIDNMKLMKDNKELKLMNKDEINGSM